jgi:hypothetical protein
VARIWEANIKTGETGLLGVQLNVLVLDSFCVCPLAEMYIRENQTTRTAPS